ncbi:hypothetical protein E2I00_011690 [Balaenoptera physalus]|uniref:F-box domain-containing protein n=1 Tax=Balaenoptera physalus TaxID=9770 RepID=A0A643C1S6_BALPH|nr:hypothetical protein E2I00_011690 [Balaenoptera physalus]
MKLRIQDELEASALVPSDLLCYQLEKVPEAPTSTNSPQCPFFFPQMLTYILSFLPLSDQKEASLVSRAWCCAAQNALREANVRYNIPVSSASLPTIKSLGLRGICCISLTNLDGSPASHQVLQSVAYHLGLYLQSLCLGGGSPTEASFVALILGCPALRFLDLSGCDSLFTSGMLLAQPKTAQWVQQALSGLRELNLASLQDLTDLSFNRLSSCVPSLERLALAYCHLTFEPDPARGSIGPQDSSPSQLSFHNLLQFVKEQAGRLHALGLSGTGLPPEALQALGQVAGLQLQELSLHSCRDLSTEAVAALCHQQPGLTSLDLRGCSELADGALLAVSRGLRRLWHLSLRKLQQLTDARCSALGGLRELHSLDMAECCLVRGRELAQALGLVCGAPHPLASLSLAYCSSLKTVQAICTYLTHLSVPRLAWCKELRDRGLLGLGQPSPAPLTLQTLQDLDLTACSKLTDASLTKVLQVPQLRRLSLSLLPALTDKGLLAAARGCPSVERLVLSLQPPQRRRLGPGSRLPAEAAAPQPVQVQSARGAGLGWGPVQGQALTQWPPCGTLGSTGQACKQLRMVGVAMCPGISMASIRRFQAQLPEVTCVQSRFMGGAELTLTL